ncbi:MAG: S8 family peptidase [Janthinobacterium lividum]
MRLHSFALAAALLPSSFALISTPAQTAATTVTGLSPEAVKQIQDIYELKASLTPAERKLSTNLLLLSRMSQGRLPASLVRFVRLPARNSVGKFAVEVHGHLSTSLLSSGVMDVDKTSVSPRALAVGRVHASMGEVQLLKLAQDADVESLREAAPAHTNVGSFTSQGYVSHAANKVVATGVTGAGIKVGVLSDSAYPARVAALIASGDLPADTVVLPGQAGPSDNSGEDEGAAMMEIVHDMAPGAKLFFASAFNSEDSFAANIRTLRYTYGCDIIVDDISYFDEPAFQDGEIAQAVNDVTASGALYFSSAANSGNLSSGTSGTWEGDFTSSTTSPTIITTREGKAVALNNFSTTGTPQAYDTLTSAASSGIWLHWSDPTGAAVNDYDLFVTNAAGTSITGFSIDRQDGTGDPLEYVYTGGTLASGSRIYVAQYSGAARALHIDTERATLSIGTSGATFGHNAGASTFSAAAVYWNAARRGPIPFTGGSTNPDESFSSDGPRKIFYNPDGTPITPNNFLFATSGGRTLTKPDAAGADGVSTATPGFLPFFGTSAAAPHLAGIAALVKSANPSLTNTQIRSIMTGTTLDNMAAGVDRDSGYGIVSAAKAVAAAQAIR